MSSGRIAQAVSAKLSQLRSQNPQVGSRRRNQGKAMPGANELYNIVVGLKRDIKRLESLSTKRGAQAYVKSKGLNWNVEARDVDGDGITDIMTTDRQGNMKSINGYITTASDYPYRQRYLDEKIDARMEGRVPRWSSQREAISDFYGPERDADGQITGFSNDRTEFDRTIQARGYKARKPRSLTANQAFTKYIVKPIYNVLLSHNSIEGPAKKEFPFLQTSSRAWNTLVAIPVLQTLIENGHPQQQGESSDQHIARLKKTKAYREICETVVHEFINGYNHDQEILGQLVTGINKCFDQPLNDIPQNRDAYIDELANVDNNAHAAAEARYEQREQRAQERQAAARNRYRVTDESQIYLPDPSDFSG